MLSILTELIKFLSNGAFIADRSHILYLNPVLKTFLRIQDTQLENGPLPIDKLIHRDASPKAGDISPGVEEVRWLKLRDFGDDEKYHCLEMRLVPLPDSLTAFITKQPLDGNGRGVIGNETMELRMYELSSAYHGTLSALNRILDFRDPYNARHHQRVSDLSRAIASVMGLSRSTVEAVRVSGAIHDIGKLLIPSEIIAKPGALSQAEMNLIKIHPEAGYEILKTVDFPWPVAEIIRQHHERLDGSGYPQGLKKEEICLEARIIAVADVAEAIISYRPYRPALSLKEALQELKKGQGTLYDPEVVEACLFLFGEIGYTFDNRGWVANFIKYKNRG